MSQLCLRNVDPPYVRCYNVMKVLGKQLTKALGPAERQGAPREAQHVPTESVAAHRKRAR